MPDLKSIYGIGKGSAQVVDLRPVQDYTESNRLANEKKAAQKLAKKATKAAALDSMVGKLKTEGWTRHNEYLQGKLENINDYVMSEIGENGETVFADDPKKQAELKNNVQDFISWNQWSKGLSTQANQQLTRAQKNRKEIDIESLGEFNNWLDQSPEYQRTNPMPIIKDRNRNLNEIMKDDYSSVLGKMSTRNVYTGKPDDEGRISKSDITITNPEEFDSFVNNINSDPNNPANIEAGEMAARFIEGEGIVGQTIINENGEEVTNPKYLDRYNNLKKQYIREGSEVYLPKEQKIHTATYKTKDDPSKELSVTEVTEGEREYVSEDIPDNIKKMSKVSKVGTIGDKKYYQLATPIFTDKVSGKRYTSQKAVTDAGIPESDIEEISIGTWVDNNYNIPKNYKEIKETTEKKKHPVVRETTIQNSPTKKVRVSEIILPNGKKETQSEGTIIEGKLVGYHKKNIVESKDRIIHEDEKGYSPKHKSAKTIEVVTIQKKDGSTVETRVTDEIREIYGKEFEKIGDGGQQNVTESEYNNLKVGDTYWHNDKKYTKK